MHWWTFMSIFLTQHLIESWIFLTFQMTSLQMCTVELYRQWSCEVRLILMKVWDWKQKVYLYETSLFTPPNFKVLSQQIKKKTEQTQASVNAPHLNTDNKKNRALILRSQTLTSAPLEKQVHHLEYECLAWMASASWIKRTRASCFFDGDHTACSHRISVIRYYWFHNTHTVFQMYTFSYIKSSCYQYHLNQSWWWSDSVGAHRRMSSCYWMTGARWHVINNTVTLISPLHELYMYIIIYYMSDEDKCADTFAFVVRIRIKVTNISPEGTFWSRHVISVIFLGVLRCIKL